MKRRRLLQALGLGAAGAAAAGLTLARSGQTDITSLRQPLNALSPQGPWLNAASQTQAPVGKVAVINFWTYSCINSLRPLPYLRAWADKYEDRGLAVIGVHTPEFAFEHDMDRVRRAIARERITYPVAIDNDQAIWNAFENDAWPAFHFADARGRIRHRAAGEGNYEQSERLIQQLLSEARDHGVNDVISTPMGTGVQAPADWDDLRSGETYVGYAKASNFESAGALARDSVAQYEVGAIQTNHWGLKGAWQVGPEYAAANAGAGLKFRFHARDLNLVLGRADGAPVRFRITVDGARPGENHGVDVGRGGEGFLNEDRLYQLVRQRLPIVDRDFEITFEAPGARAYVFTFG